MKLPILFSKKRERWFLFDHFGYYDLGSEKEMLKLFVSLLLSKKKKIKEGSGSCVDINRGPYMTRLIWSRALNEFFIETHIDGKQISSFPIKIKKERMEKQIDWFIKRFPKLKEKFEEIRTLYNNI